MNRYSGLLMFGLLALLIACTGPRDVQITFPRLTVDGREAPLAIETQTPLFGWQLTSPMQGGSQSAWQILVASTPDLLKPGKANFWDSGKVVSAQSQGLRYTGIPLPGKQVLYWKVRVWNENGHASDWSMAQRFSTGIFNPKDWQAKWISSRPHEVSAARGYFGTYEQKEDKNPGDTAAILMRREMNLLNKPSRAMAYICGLGYYELYINGSKVGNHIMDPVFSDYQRSVYYLSYDVTEYLKAGMNYLGAILGNGFYNTPTQDLFMIDQAHWKTPPKLLFHLDIELPGGGRQIVVSDGNWQWSTGEIVWNCIRGGETIDARKVMLPGQWHAGAAGSGRWQPVAIVPPPLGDLKAQQIPAMCVQQVFDAEAMWEPKPGVYVFDFGENITGWARLQTGDCETGRIITLHFNEVLGSDSTLDINHSRSHTRGRFQKGHFICDGSGAGLFQPRFTYHGFRYVQVEGLPYRPKLSDIIAESVHTDLPSAGTFACSNERLNQLHAAVRHTLLNSVHSMPGEEPTREKMGWTYDAGMVTMETYLYNFDAITTYRKYLQDLIDGQEPNGHIPPIVPTNGWGFIDPSTGKPVLYDDPWWGSTIYFVSAKLYEWTADTTILAHAYEPMRKYLEFVGSTADDSLLVHWSLGDWLDPKQWSKGWGPGLTPIVQTSTACYFWMARRLAATARILGKTEDGASLESLADRIRSNFNAAFLNRQTGWYADSSQTAQAVPLYYDLAPTDMRDKIEARLLDAIRWNNGHISTGFVGVQPILKYLSENGHIQLAYNMVAKERSPGWLHMIQNGVRSTLSENLNAEGYGTGHHPFGACVGHWFYQYLAGIKLAEIGWKEFIIEPGVVDELDWVEASIESPYGLVSSRWERTSDNQITYTIRVPVNTRAVFRVNGKDEILGAGSHVIKR